MIFFSNIFFAAEKKNEPGSEILALTTIFIEFWVYTFSRGVKRPKFEILKIFAGGQGGRIGPLVGPGQRPGGGPGGFAPGSSWILREIKAQYAISWNSFKCYVLCKSKIRCTNIFQEWFIMWRFGKMHVIFPLDLHVYTSLAVYL